MAVDFPKNENQTVIDPVQRKLGWGWLVFFLSIVALLWFLTLVHSLLWIATPQDRAYFGEMFGSVNALFSGLAFATIIFTLFLHKHVLELQRQELRDSREQFKIQADQLEAQAQRTAKQNFEDTFFRMLEILTRQARDVTTTHSTTQEQLKGPEAFRYLYSQFMDCYKTLTDEEVSPGLSKHEHAFMSILRPNRELLTYFGTFVHTLSLLDTSEVKNKAFYGTFMSSQLHSSEKLLLFYDGLCGGLIKTKARMEKYFILTAIRLNDLVEVSHRVLYDNRAWTPFNEESR
jgi:Putative phage abortive infection protein